MAVEIKYSYAEYKSNHGDISKPLSTAEYERIKQIGDVFRIAIKSSITESFDNEQGTVKKILFYVYLVLALLLGVLFYCSLVGFELELPKGDYDTYLGILGAIFFVFIPVAFSYGSSLFSFLDFRRELLSYYKEHIKLVSLSTDYNEYLAKVIEFAAIRKKEEAKQQFRMKRKPF